ncbi:MAG TPA: type 2 lanthipeptide synthetase LanM family protein [Pseudonocardiaceae bacterium]
MNDSASSATGLAGLLGSSWWSHGLTLRERPESDAAVPGWAGFVQRAVARAPENASAIDASAGFAAVFAPLVTLAAGEVAEEVALAGSGLLDAGAIKAGFRALLGDRLGTVATRALVTELHIARTDGRLVGSTSEERFADFVRTTGTGRGLAGLFSEYPVLARLLGTACRHAATAHREILARWRADRAVLVAKLLDGVDPGPLASVSPGSGDYHRRGRSVAVLTFASGAKIVYKPRSLALQAHFDELVGWLNGAVPWLGLRTPVSVPRGDYGWQEFVSYQPCTELAEVEMFYQRQGALLALLNALDGTDIHHENVIAVADQPVLIDVETLFHPTLLPHAVTGPDPALRALMSSVHRTSMLPTLVVGEHGVLDMSGVGGDRDRTYPLDVVNVADAGTDRMRIVRAPSTFTGSNNRPRIGDDDAVPEAHSSALITGFRAAYDAIAHGAEELLADDGPVRRCVADEMRIVVRPTRVYGTLLTESTHPDVLRDALDRDELFGMLATDAVGELPSALTTHEIDDMWAGDVPIFLGKPGSRQVRTSSGATVAGLLDQTGLASVTAKIGRMGEVDRRDQEWVIRAALASRAEPDEHASGVHLSVAVTAILPDPERLLSSACGIADKIVARALHDEHRANWLTMEQIDGRHWMVLPMGAGLGSGYSGVALFLAQLGALTGISRYTDLARKAMRPIPRLIDAISTDPTLAQAIGCGGFLGLGGISYALARLANLLGDADLLTWLVRMVPLVGRADDASQTSVAAGRAGGLAAMLAVHAETGLADARALAGEFAHRLARPVRPDPVALLGDSLPSTGFAWGETGVGWALLRFAEAERTTPSGRGQAAADGRGPNVGRVGESAGFDGAGSGFAGSGAGFGGPGAGGTGGGAGFDGSAAGGLSAGGVDDGARFGAAGGGFAGPGAGGAGAGFAGPNMAGVGEGAGFAGPGVAGPGAGRVGAGLGSGGAVDFAALGRAALARDPGPDVSVAEPNRDYSWCSGLAGRLLGRAADRPIAADDPWLGLFADRPVLRDMSLCHGELGVLNALLALGDLPAAMAERGAAFLLGALERFGPSCALPGGVSGPGLLTGLAGIGYGLLRLGMPEQVPSVLLFEPRALSRETSYDE